MITLTPTATKSDSELVAQTLNGNDKAFRELVKRYNALVFNFLFKMTQNRDLAEEVAHESFVKAYKNLHTFERSRPFKPWILRIASNAALSEMRKTSKVSSLDALEESGQWREADHAPTEDFTEAVDARFTSENVMKAIEELEPNYRQALLLRYNQDLSYEEIAQTMNVPINTIRTWIKRGRERLRGKIKSIQGD